MEKTIEEYTHYISSAFNVESHIGIDGSIVVEGIQYTQIVPLLSMLKLDQSLKFDQLIDLFGVDYPEKEDRFQLIYLLLSINYNIRAAIKVSFPEDIEIPTVTHLFSNADWLEREAFDLYGIKFLNHPNLKRILTDYGFKGHPMLKDFPLSGYSEVMYSNEDGKVVYRPIDLQQGFRRFDTLSPWGGSSES